MSLEEMEQTPWNTNSLLYMFWMEVIPKKKERFFWGEKPNGPLSNDINIGIPNVIRPLALMMHIHISGFYIKRGIFKSDCATSLPPTFVIQNGWSIFNCMNDFQRFRSTAYVKRFINWLTYKTNQIENKYTQQTYI